MRREMRRGMLGCCGRWLRGREAYATVGDLA